MLYVGSYVQDIANQRIETYGSIIENIHKNRMNHRNSVNIYVSSHFFEKDFLNCFLFHQFEITKKIQSYNC